VRAIVGLVFVLSAAQVGCATRPPAPATLVGADARADEGYGAGQDRAAGESEAKDARPAPRDASIAFDCYEDFAPSDDAAADLARLTRACGVRAGLSAVTPVHVGAQRRDDPVERLTFRARKKRCYRAFAVGAPTIADLDMAIKDPDGDLLAGDLSRDRFPVVPPRGLLCAPRGGRFSLEIAVAEGNGEYFLQIWGTRGEDDDDEPEAP
jgi:hypothetical protein